MPSQTSDPQIPVGAACLRNRYARRAGATGRLVGLLSAATFLCCRPAFAEQREPNEEGGKVEVVFQELFLGELVFPQEQGEFQLTTGYFYGHKGKNDSLLPVVLEYGITDRLQIAAAFPVEFLHSEPGRPEGLGNVELEVYYNFFNDAASGRACGVGFSVGLPTATSEVGKQAVIYEPLLVVYQELGAFSVNCFAGLEIEDPITADDETEVGGQIGVAAFRKFGPFIPVLELAVEIEEDQRRVRLAPALYWQPRHRAKMEFGVAVPFGMTDDAPDLGVFLLATWEFGGD